MEKSLLLVGSVTHALAGRELLSQRGIAGSVLRVPRTSRTGCGYALTVPPPGAAAAQVLEEGGIRVLGIEEEGERP